MSRKQRRRRNRKAEWAEYRVMVKRVLSGEVARLFWKPVKEDCPVRVEHGALVIEHEGIPRTIPPGDLQSFEIPVEADVPF